MLGPTATTTYCWPPALKVIGGYRAPGEAAGDAAGSAMVDLQIKRRYSSGVSNRARGLARFDDLLQDLRYAARTLRRSPGFTAVALVTLTLAIGATTAIFSLVDPLLFRDLPVRDPSRLVEFVWRYPGDPPLNLFGIPYYERYRDHNTVFSDMAGLAPFGGEGISGEVVTGNLFQAVGVGAALGRLLETSDDTTGAEPVAVVSWQYWQRRFNGDMQVLGSAIDINDPRLPVPVHARVVGVTDRGFTGLRAGYRPEVWVSLAAIPEAARSRGMFALIARLRPGASIDQARAEMRVLDQARIAGFAQRDPQWRQVLIDVKPARTGLSTPLRDQFAGPLFVLMFTVGVLLLLACANIGSLLLARGAARQHEMAVRVSLGAGRFRIMRQVMTESLLLAAAGSVLGFAGARAAATVLVAIVTSGTRSIVGPPQFAIPLDARVLIFTAGVTTIAALLFGLAPALAAFGSAPIAALRGRAGSTPARSRRLFSSGLVIVQVALSLALVTVSQLYVAHLGRLRDRSLGFDRDGVLLVSVNPSEAGRAREQLIAQYAEAIPRLKAIPGVRSVAVSGMTPISGAAGSRFVRADGYDEPAQARRRLPLNNVSPDYFATLGTPLLAGRDFRESDAARPRLVIVNQAMARQYFAGRDPIGQRLWFDTDQDPYEVVGVAGDAKYQDVRIGAPPTVYIYAPVFRGSSDLSIRTVGAPTRIADEARRIVADVFGAGAVRRVTTLAEQVDVSIVPERLMAMLSGFFGVVGALLAAIGLYGLLAYTVARRTNEIGIRMALGATRGDVIGMVLKTALSLVLAGVIVGVPAAFWGRRLAASLVEHLPAGGVAPIGVAIASLFVVALVAAYVPARRATRVDPIAALRSE
jgi:predicted permease